MINNLILIYFLTHFIMPRLPDEHCQDVAIEQLIGEGKPDTVGSIEEGLQLLAQRTHKQVFIVLKDFASSVEEIKDAFYKAGMPDVAVTAWSRGSLPQVLVYEITKIPTSPQQESSR